MSKLKILRKSFNSNGEIVSLLIDMMVYDFWISVKIRKYTNYSL